MCSNSLLNKFSIKDCEIFCQNPTPATSTLHSQHNLRVELQITIHKQVEVEKEFLGRRQQDFEMVEQYLQLAGAGVEEVHQPDTVLVAEDVTEEEEGGKEEQQGCSQDGGEGELVQFCGDGDDKGGDFDMLVCLDEHDAAQFLSVYYLIKNGCTSPDNVYGVKFT